MAVNRYETRRRKKMSRFLNIAIGVVVLLILGVGAQILLSGDDEPANTASQEETDNDTSGGTSSGSGISDPASTNEDDEAVEEDEDDSTTTADGRVEDDEDQATEDDDQAEEDDANEDADNEEESQEDGEWEPVGTEQTGEFTPNFDQGSQNWNEMVAALQSATGISSSDMTLWRLENGGSPTAAVGTLSDSDSMSNPYRVRIEWQDGQGWQAVSSEQLDSNPYR
ncbi:DUF1510 family protein [Alkalicoccobacillus plakortidis]|uniref:DUF1510 family protein n=1 Tax=Alkalicoccobacillus plakortidis TaxID=444060 RepID=A0ABT0XMW6_9BACI|nr:DUF1510 family protein [Alkalicoccobacillus plakortidis]MCM2676572.1 DUF1510 family protein [Alkalicoccobacillus plakortidis]